MPQALRQTFKWNNFNYPVSYNVNDQNKMRDARNVYSKEDLLKTRPGIARYNGTAIGSTSTSVVSISYFEKTDGTKKVLSKAGTILYDTKETGAHTSVKTGLTSGIKHRSVTVNDRAIVAIGTDGLFSYDGTTFTQLGQAPPGAPSAAVSGSGNTLPAGDYQVAITFYSSTYGFETNIGTASSTVTVASGERIDVTSIPTSAANAFIDSKRVYVKDITNNSDWLFWSEIDLAVTTETIDEEITSTQTPPTKNAPPVSGGGKYIAVFGNRIAVAGNNTFKEEVYLSEEYLPDAFDDTATRKIIRGYGQGPITGLGVGLYNMDNLSPYLCIFKRNSVQVYSELGGIPSLSVVSTKIGCVSHDTIQEIDGDIYFMSTLGWYRIHNGTIEKSKGLPVKLGEKDMDSIFTQSGYVYELNQSDSQNFFSVYYSRLGHYMTFISEGSNTSKNKCYNFELDLYGFRPHEFPMSFNGACVIENSDGEEIVLFAGDNGRVYKYSLLNNVTDVDMDNNNTNIDAFAQLFWIAHDDMDATMNFGTMNYRALSTSNPLEVRCFFNYELDDAEVKEYDFNKSGTGFILDVSLLDVGILGDGRTIARATGFIGRTSQSLLIGFYKSVENESIDLISGQVDASKNGNPN